MESARIKSKRGRAGERSNERVGRDAAQYMAVFECRDLLEQDVQRPSAEC